MEKIGKWELISTLTIRTVVEFLDDMGPLLARSIAYYAFISLFPLMVLIIAVAGIFIDVDKAASLVFEQLALFIYPGTEEESIVYRDSFSNVSLTGAAGIFGIVGLLWSASGMFGALRRTINEAWDIKRFRPILRQKLTDFVLVACFGFFIFASVLSTVVISIIRDLDLVWFWGFLFDYPWGVVPLILPGVLSFFAFTFTYWFIPHTKVEIKHAIYGGLFAAVLFEATKSAFILGMGAAISGNALYGTMGAIIGLLFWLYISSSIVLLGAEFTSEIPRVLSGDYRKSKGSGSGRRELKEALRKTFRKMIFQDE